MTDPTEYARDMQFFTAIRDSEEPEVEPRGGGVATVLVLSLAVLFGFAAGYALGDVPTVATGPGYDICTTKGC